MYRTPRIGGLRRIVLLGSLLFGVGTADLPMYASVAVLLGAIAVVASYVPARRAARVDPMLTLRAGE
jgi:putative ABC transport system permease protein